MIFISGKIRSSGDAWLSGLGTPPYRYWRIVFYQWLHNGVVYTYPDDDVTGTSIRTEEFELMVGATPHPTSNMTGYTTPSPLVVVNDGDHGGGFDQWHAFDGVYSDAGRYISNSGNNTHSIKLDLGSGNDITPTSYKLTPDGAVAFAGTGYHIMGWYIHGSNTGAYAGEEGLIDYKKWVGYHRWGGWANHTQRTFNLNLTPTKLQHRYWRIKDITVPSTSVKPRGLRWKASGTDYALDAGTWVTTTPSANYLANLYDGSATEPNWADTVIENAAFYFLLDLGEGNRRTIDAIQLQGGGTANDYFDGFTLQYSDDAVTWTDAFTKSGLTYPGAGVWSSDYTA